jgi:hypothetical protein
MKKNNAISLPKYPMTTKSDTPIVLKKFCENTKTCLQFKYKFNQPL